MDEDAIMAFGTVLAALGGILERAGVCSTMELAETLGGVTMMTQEAGPEYARRAAYIGSWAHMVRAAAIGAARTDKPLPN
jgi:hypothetical protein